MSRGVVNLQGASCDKSNYEGWFFETTLGPSSFDIGYDDSNWGLPGQTSGTYEKGYNASFGLDMAASAKWCYYVFDSEETLKGCCD